MEKVFSSLFEQALERAEAGDGMKHDGIENFVLKMVDTVIAMPCEIHFKKTANSVQSSVELSGGVLSLMNSATIIIQSVMDVIMRSDSKADRQTVDTMLTLFSTMVNDALRGKKIAGARDEK